MASGDPFSNNLDKNLGTSGAGSSATGASGSVRPEGVTGRPASTLGNAHRLSDSDSHGTERRYSFNMLLATAVAGYAIGRLLPR